MRKLRESSMALVFGRLLVALLLALCFVAAIAPRVVPAADVTTTLDQATLGDGGIGNPLIADASIQPGGVMVITGEGHGTTTLIMLPIRP
jgi:hypothetical protein